MKEKEMIMERERSKKGEQQYWPKLQAREGASTNAGTSAIVKQNRIATESKDELERERNEMAKVTTATSISSTAMSSSLLIILRKMNTSFLNLEPMNLALRGFDNQI
ncbi:hypothetical protein RB195_017856 [Necator americanus]|uniref:Uncharacterized protein n=1 Tax=Necator americanus TaxID=51031 RepID=A0ABR1C728_NECAM